MNILAQNGQHQQRHFLQSEVIRSGKVASKHSRFGNFRENASLQGYKLFGSVQPKPNSDNKPLISPRLAVKIARKSRKLMESIDSSHFHSFKSQISVHIPHTINGLMTHLIKKILVYSSKIESLQEKLCLQDPSFHPRSLFRGLDVQGRGYINLDQLALLLYSFDSQKSDWMSFCLMDYLSSYNFLPLQSTLNQARSFRSLEMFLEKCFQIEESSGLNKMNKKMETPLYLLTENNFCKIFESKHHRLYSDRVPGQMAIGVQDAMIIRNIFSLHFRKLKEMGKVMEAMKKYPCQRIYDFLRANQSNFV